MRYLDLLQVQLVEASRELSEVNGSVPRSRTRLRAMVSRHTRTSAAVAIVGFTAVSAAIAGAAGVTIPAFWEHEYNVPSPVGAASAIPSDMTSSFAILRNPRQPAIDALPAAGVAQVSTAGGLGLHYGVNPDLSRFVGTLNGMGAVWLVPGKLGSCVYDANGLACGSNVVMSTRGSLELQLPVAGGPDTFTGVVPDGATVTATNNDGSAAAVSRSGNAYVIDGDPNLRSVTIHETGGQESTSTVPTLSPPNAGATSAR
jgi:hypothetical protein